MKLPFVDIAKWLQCHFCSIQLEILKSALWKTFGILPNYQIHSQSWINLLSPDLEILHKAYCIQIQDGLGHILATEKAEIIVVIYQTNPV